MKMGGERLKGKKLKFLQALLSESTVTKALEKAGISRSTGYEYLKDEEFQNELTKRKTECIDDTIRYLQSKLSLCNETLISIIEDSAVAPQVKINAINTVYATCKSMTEAAEIMGMSDQVAAMAQWIEAQESEGE